MPPERLPWMPWMQPGQEPPNRAARRRASRGEAFELRDQLGDLDGEFDRTATNFDRISQEHGHHFARIIYQGEPFVGEYLSACRRLHVFLDRAQWINLKRPFAPSDHLNRVDSDDLFSVNVEGTSLADIERMPLPLLTDDIKRINKMWHEPFFGRSKNQERLVKCSMIYLATQSVMGSDKDHISPELLPLTRRLTNYFDYYTNLTTDFSLNDNDETDFLMTLVFVGKDMQIRALGCYIPARLGILPSSAIKLYHQRAESSFMGNLGWRAIIKKMADESQYAFLKNGLPDDLVRYGRYDPKMDEIVTNNLVEYYRAQGLEGFKKDSELVESDEIIKTFGSNRNLIHREIRRSNGKRLNFGMPEEQAISKVTVTSQNRETVIFILHFADGRSHLTLEMDKNNNLYGVPPKISSDYPHLADLLLRDVLGQTLKRVAPEPIVVRRIIEPVVVAVPIEETEEETTKNQQAKEEQGQIKRKRMRPWFRRRVAEEPELPIPHEQPHRQFSVIHSRAMLRDMLGGKSRPDDINRIMEHIRRFEFGQVPVKTIVWSGGKRQVIRKGKFRIILNHLGSGLYQMENVSDREYVYEGYSDRRVY